MSDNFDVTTRSTASTTSPNRHSPRARKLRRFLPHGGVWANHEFLKLWAANTISDFGTHITMLALPLTAALTLDASAFEMGLLSASEWLPFLVLGLFAGVLVDRAPRQRLLIVTDWLRAGLLALVPAAAVGGWLRMELLFAVAFAVGVCSVIFQVAHQSWLPSLVPRRDLGDANSKLEASYASAQAAGPALAGAVAGWIGAPLAVSFNALSFAISALFVMRVRGPSMTPAAVSDALDHGPAGPASVLRDIAQGLNVVGRDPLLRATTGCSGTTTFFGWMFMAVYVLFMTRTLDLGATVIGLILTCGGIGAVIGAVVTERFNRRFGLGWTVIWAQIVFAVASLLVPAAVIVPAIAIPMLALSEFVQYGTLAIYSVGARSLRQSLVADHLQGRVNATVRTITGGTTMAGSLAGGALGVWIGLGETLTVGSIGMMLASLWVIRSPMGNVRTLPDEPTQTIVEDQPHSDPASLSGEQQASGT